jgi:hypothetical protein
MQDAFGRVATGDEERTTTMTIRDLLLLLLRETIKAEEFSMKNKILLLLSHQHYRLMIREHENKILLLMRH